MPIAATPIVHAGSDRRWRTYTQLTDLEIVFRSLDWLGGFTLAAFRDMGWITVNTENWPSYSSPDNRELAGNGLSVSLDRRDMFSLKAI